MKRKRAGIASVKLTGSFLSGSAAWTGVELSRDKNGKN
jgi:hypothetical protein